jgi:hypothetical protein
VTERFERQVGALDRRQPSDEHQVTSDGGCSGSGAAAPP